MTSRYKPRQNKSTRQDKTRHDKTGQAKTKKPSLRPLPPREQDRLRTTPLHTLRFFSLHFPQTIIFIFFINRHFHLPCLCSVCNVVTVHTHATDDYPHLHPDSKTWRERKQKTVNRKREMKEHQFYKGILTMSFTSIRPSPFLPNFHLPSHHCHHDPAKHEEEKLTV